MTSDIVFALENAGWPSLLVDSSGKIFRANQAAISALGGSIQEGSSDLGKFWSSENISSLTDFLQSSATPMASHSLVKFNVRGGEVGSFVTYVSGFLKGDKKLYVLQLFTPQRAPTSAHSEAAPKSKSAEAPAAGAAVDASIAHKQKLDCALQLARTVALDFNNALTSILGHASLLLSKAEPQHPWQNSLIEIEKSAEKAAEIANDLANFSRQEKEQRTQQGGNLNALLQRCVDAFRTPENAHIEFQLQPERKLFTAPFDEAKLQQAIFKILENSVQAIGENGRVVITTRNLELSEPFQDRTVKLAPGTYVATEISDNGSGISPEALPRIFEPFFTTKGSNHRGLGLAWVYGIVTNHGGGVAVSSQPGSGTSVRVYLPATKKIVKQSHVEALGANDLCGIETVLMVDDEELLLNMGQMVLSSFGYRALIATSGQRALEILNEEMVDLVITDLVMPNMSGRELIDRIKKVAPDTKIICSSGYLRASNSADEEAYLQKPFTAQELLRKVKETLATPNPA